MTTNQADKLLYFKIAKELNDKWHDVLVSKELHFRGNINSFSIISINQQTPECGKGGLTSYKEGEAWLNRLIPEKPGRRTEEKNLQAYIISYSLKNNLRLPFGDFTFLTSELAYPLEGKKKIVNDILAIDSDRNLVIIELKSSRTNKVKKQIIEFESAVVNTDPAFISKLMELLSLEKWSGKTRKVAVWPATSTSPNIKQNTYDDVELFSYKYTGTRTNESIIMDEVSFERED